MHLVLTPDNEHNKVFRDVPITGFRRAKSLKGIVMKVKIPHLKSKGSCGSSKAPRFEIYKHIVPIRNFSSFTTKHTYEIRSENLNSKNVVFDVLQNLSQTIYWKLREI